MKAHPTAMNAIHPPPSKWTLKNRLDPQLVNDRQVGTHSFPQKKTPCVCVCVCVCSVNPSGLDSLLHRFSLPSPSFLPFFPSVFPSFFYSLLLCMCVSNFHIPLSTMSAHWFGSLECICDHTDCVPTSKWIRTCAMFTRERSLDGTRCCGIWIVTFCVAFLPY